MEVIEGDVVLCEFYFTDLKQSKKGGFHDNQ